VEDLVDHQPYHTLLQDAFQSRREKNPSYSLRAFSRAVGISPTTLSKVFRYERNLSPKNLKRLAEFLELSPFEMARMSVKGLDKLRAKKQGAYRNLEDDEFHVISDWYYFGILSLARTSACQADARWIAKRLGISSVEAQGALRRLDRLGLVKKQGRKLIRTSVLLHTTNDVPSSALRKFHRQQLGLASQAVDNVPLDRRMITSTTMAIDPSRIALAKKKMAEFRDALSDFLEAGEKKEVYLLSLQLFPLEKPESAT
jgi:uncharacterized protein (TIGR02147 family)